eukprot:GAHX01001034.1.p1 GENE.GAHX01001034.1~~GAHX01001034.1.p1  ORF type:complete len:550 (+),score=134.45 GAHX01001034.1:41-1690(+)
MVRQRSSSKGWNIPTDQPAFQHDNRLSYGDDSILNDMDGYIQSDSNNSAADSLARFKNKRKKVQQHNDVHSGMFYHAQNPDEMSDTNRTSEDTHTMSLSEIQGINGLRANQEINKLNIISKNNINMERLLLNQDIHNRNKARTFKTTKLRKQIVTPETKKKTYKLKNNSCKLPTITQNKPKVYFLKNGYINNNTTEKQTMGKINKLQLENNTLKTKNKNLLKELEELEIEVQSYNEEVTKKLNDVTIEHEEVGDLKSKCLLLTKEKQELKASLYKIQKKLGNFEHSTKSQGILNNKFKYDVYNQYNKVSDALRSLDNVKQLTSQLKNSSIKCNRVIKSIRSAKSLFNEKEIEWTANLKAIKLYLKQFKETKQNKKKVIDDLYKTLEEQSDFIKNNYQSLDFNQNTSTKTDSNDNAERYDEKGILLAILETLNELKHAQKQQTQTNNFLFRSMQTQVDNLKQNRLYSGISDLKINQRIAPIQKRPYRRIEDIRDRVKREIRRKEEEEKERPNSINDTFIEKRDVVKDSMGLIENQTKKLSEIFTYTHFNK